MGRDWFIGAELGALTKEKCVNAGWQAQKVPAYSLTVPATSRVVCCPSALLLSIQGEEFLLMHLSLPLHCKLPEDGWVLPSALAPRCLTPGLHPNGDSVPGNPLNCNLSSCTRRTALRSLESDGRTGVMVLGDANGGGCGPLPSTAVQILRVLWSDKIHHWSRSFAG